MCVGAGKETLQVDIATDRYPEETTYTLVNLCTGITEASRDYRSLYTLEESQYSDVLCVSADQSSPSQSTTRRTMESAAASAMENIQ